MSDDGEGKEPGPVLALGKSTLVAMMRDGTSFATEITNFRLEDGRLWIRSTTWPDGRDVEGEVTGLLLGTIVGDV